MITLTRLVTLFPGASSARTLTVATEDELLEFANRIRSAGGGDIIDGLLPSIPGEPEACLIANALNFSCEVSVTDEPMTAEGGHVWYMSFTGVDHDKAQAIADVAEAELHVDSFSGTYAVHLPEHIGNAADAFDAEAAFTNYHVERDDD